MCEGVNARRAVKEDGRGNEETPDEHLPSRRAVACRKEGADCIEAYGEQGGDEGVEAIEKNQLGVFREVRDFGVIGWKIFLTRNPADVRPPEAIDHGRVFVVFFVGVLVMVSVSVGPPEGATLHGEGGPDRHDELEGTRRGKSFVRKVAMEEARDGEHAEEVEAHGRPDRDGTCSHPDDSEAA